MSGRKEHEKAAMVAGGLAAFISSHEASGPLQRALETFGGTLGGLLGGRLPDILEPATHGWHRDLGHSVSTGVTIVTGVSKIAAAWRSSCLTHARCFSELQRDLAVPNGQRALFAIAEVFWIMAAGALVGSAAGYLSHLALDATTPRSIPLLTRGLQFGHR